MNRAVYLVWRDCVGLSQYRTPEQVREAAQSCVLRGRTHVIYENETDIVVAHFLADDGGMMDVIAIPRASVLEIVDL